METNPFHIYYRINVWWSTTSTTKTLKTITLIGLMILFLGIHGTSGECPRLCECKWKSGKESVLCLNANLTGVPNELDAGTQILDLTGNEISAIPHDAFSSVNLINLQKIFIAKCRLKVIDRYAFRKLKNLVELDLSYNVLTMIPSHAFDSTPELRELKLIGNPIQRVLNDAFLHVPKLTRLELTDCRIGTIEPRAFAELSSLEFLKIDGNKLTEVQVTTLSSLEKLRELELDRNPWNCSCALRPLRKWMLEENISKGIPPICRFPQRLSTKSWDKIDLDDFACIPHILAQDLKAHGVEGKNITMSCVVGGVPEPNVRWLLRNRIIANLSGNTVFPAAQGRKMYVANLQQNESNLTILTAEVQDAGIYTCAAENKAGRVEASVTLAVSRKPPDGPLSAKVLIASIIVAALFVIASSLAVICICTLRKRRKIVRWNTQRRTESYEKIEMNHKPNSRGFKSPRGGAGGVGDCNNFMKPYGENGISVVGQVRRNGDYRTVPSEDDGTGYEDNVESTNTTLSNCRRDSTLRWKGSAGAAAASKSPNANSNNEQWSTECKNSPRGEETDLHIPRLIEFSDATPDSGPSSLTGQYEQQQKSTHTQPSSGSSFNGYKPNWTQHIMRKQTVGNNGNTVFSTSECSTIATKNQNILSDNNRTPESDCDSERKYPDLLDISSFSNNNSINNNNHSSTNGNSLSNKHNSSSSSSAFCTLPRKKHSSGRYMKAVSESQSPLLPSDSSSRYGSSSFGGEANADTMIPNRRLSIDSYSNNYPLSQYLNSNKDGGRSNSFLNLAPLNSTAPGINNLKQHHGRRNPSLPSSPIKDTNQSKAFSPAATPLLDFSSLTSARNPLMATPSPSTSTTTASAYDYHAAQLERFLEEYRNLQEQLCKMKETCDSIRKKEIPHRSGCTLGQSAKFADPVMYTATALTGSAVGLTAADDLTTNPKGILKNKSHIPGQPPDPPPYWLHRNAILKRLQDPGTDFFQS